MTLGRLVPAWILVTIWFYVATILGELAAAFMLRRPGQVGIMGSVPIPIMRWKVVEAGVVTLFASLWFDSLGSGEWWLVFLLIGGSPARLASFVAIFAGPMTTIRLTALSHGAG